MSLEIKIKMRKIIKKIKLGEFNGGVKNYCCVMLVSKWVIKFFVDF